MKARDVRIHIESLVLEGFSPGDRARIVDGLERELERLVAERLPSPWTRSGNVERLEVASVKLAAAAPAERIGESIANALHGAMREPRR
jgi:plasmid stabilization system protein ParE